MILSVCLAYQQLPSVLRVIMRMTKILHSKKQKEKEATKEGVDMGADQAKEEKLPPGFRFHPTDEELITFYLVNKISDANFTGRAITDIDLNKSEPWELPGKAKMGEKEWYFFSLRDRKYPTGVRTNRATNTGYWKTTGKDKEILNSVTSEFIGMKKTLVFYKGRAPRGEKSNWVMHEYRIHSKSSFRISKDEWVVCRVFQKSAGVKKYPTTHTRTVNSYNLEIGPNFVPPQMTQLGDPAQYLYGRNYMSNAELSDINRVLRGSCSSGYSNMNLQMQPQLPYATGGNCFTMSGLNLHLGGAAASTQPMLRPTPQPQPTHQAIGQPVTANMMTDNSLVAENNIAGYGTETSNINHPNQRSFLGLEHCVDLDNYWPPY